MRNTTGEDSSLRFDAIENEWRTVNLGENNTFLKIDRIGFIWTEVNIKEGAVLTMAYHPESTSSVGLRISIGPKEFDTEYVLREDDLTTTTISFLNINGRLPVMLFCNQCHFRRLHLNLFRLQSMRSTEIFFLNGLNA